MTPGEKLAKYRHSRHPRGWSQLDLGHFLTERATIGITPDAWRARIASYEGGSANIPAPVLEQIAEATKVPLSWWTDDQDSPPPEAVSAKPMPNAKVIPRQEAELAAQSLGRGDLVQLAMWKAVGGLVVDQEVYFEETVEPTAVPSFLIGPDIDNWRVVQVSGFSMVPRINSGSQVVVKLCDAMPATGIITIVQDVERRLYCKVFRRSRDGKPELHSINGSYPVIPSKDINGWQVRAVAYGIMHAYDEPGPNIEWDSGRPLRA